MVTEEYRKSEYRSRIIARREESGFAVRNLVFTLPLISTVLKVTPQSSCGDMEFSSALE